MYPCCGYTLLQLVQPLPLLSLTPLTPTTPSSTAFSIHPYILYLHRCYVLQYYCCSIILFSSFPEFHGVVPLLLTCSTYEFAYVHACFYVCVYLLALSSTYERKHVVFVFLSPAFFT
jgi:hypothetical protein